MPKSVVVTHRKEPNPKHDYCESKRGASILADAINAYWKALGFPKVLAEPYAMRGFGMWGVKSNLFNGLPRGRDRPAGSPKRKLEARV